jgi:hypothetical protein
LIKKGRKKEKKNRERDNLKKKIIQENQETEHVLNNIGNKENNVGI